MENDGQNRNRFEEMMKDRLPQLHSVMVTISQLMKQGEHDYIRLLLLTHSDITCACIYSYFYHSEWLRDGDLDTTKMGHNEGHFTSVARQILGPRVREDILAIIAKDHEKVSEDIDHLVNKLYRRMEASEMQGWYTRFVFQQAPSA